VSEQAIVFHGEDIEELNGDDLCTIDYSDIVGVQSRDTIVEYIPEVHGNEVVELNDDAFRSWSHFRYRVE